MTYSNFTIYHRVHDAERGSTCSTWETKMYCNFYIITLALRTYQIVIDTSTGTFVHVY